MWAQHVFRGLVLFQVNGTSLLSLSNFSLYRAMAGGVRYILVPLRKQRERGSSEMPFLVSVSPVSGRICTLLSQEASYFSSSFLLVSRLVVF